MPPQGPRCKDQCAKDVAAWIVYGIYGKPRPGVSSSSVATSSSKSSVASSSAPASSSKSSVASSSAPASSSKSSAASSSAPAYEFNLANGKTLWENQGCGGSSCHKPTATAAGLNTGRTYNFIKNYLNTGSRIMPPGGPRCQDQCAKDIAGHVVYTIYKKPLPAMKPASAGTLRINVGGSDEITNTGLYFQGDNFFDGGNLVVASKPLLNSDEAIHLSARSGSFTYAIPANPGAYHLSISLVELGDKPSVFSLQVENETFEDIDVMQSAGAFRVQTLDVSDLELVDGELNIRVTAGEGTITALQLTPLAP
jgi:hypothetical protein